jgi:CO/xanthine dehydrogenase Mo-binding subunit
MKKNNIAKQVATKPRNQKASEARQAKRGSGVGPVKQVVGLDLGDKSSRYCVLDSNGTVQSERSVATTRQGFSQAFAKMVRSRIALEGDAFALGEPGVGKPGA